LNFDDEVTVVKLH